MKISNEKEEKFVRMDCDLTSDEIKRLSKLFDNNCKDQELEQIKVNWAMNYIIKKAVEEEWKPNEETN